MKKSTNGALRYASELLAFAASCAPWEVSENEFVRACAFLQDKDLPSDDRENLLAFFHEATDIAARIDPQASDPVHVYRAVKQWAKENGYPAHA